MVNLGYYNGTFGPLDEMTVPMNDRVCYFGDGVYEAAPCRNNRIFALDEHVDRMFRSAGLLEIAMPVTREKLKAELTAMSRKVDAQEQFVYWQVTRGTGDRAHTFPEEGAANLWVTVRPAKPVDYDLARKLITVEDTRFLHCNIKTLNLIPNVMASERAKRAGCHEAVFLRDGVVTECSHSNISILKDGALRTHPADNLILAGISRGRLLGVCGEQGIPVEEKAFLREALLEADEVLVTSSSTFCLRATEIDGQPVGGKDPERFAALKQAMLEQYTVETDGN